MRGKQEKCKVPLIKYTFNLLLYCYIRILVGQTPTKLFLKFPQQNQKNPYKQFSEILLNFGFKKIGMKILIADDSFLIRERLKELLSDILKIEDFIEAENSVETIKLISETIPDIVILDIRMPKGGGLEVLNKINKAMP